MQKDNKGGVSSKGHKIVYHIQNGTVNIILCLFLNIVEKYSMDKIDMK